MARASRVRFTALRRSLAAQLVAVTLIVLVLALVFYVLAPLWQLQLTRHPLASTRALASQVLFQATETDLQAATDSPDLAEIAAANPGFYYYVRHDGEELQFGEPPRLIDTVDLSVPVAAASQAPESGWACESFSFWNSQFTEHGMTTNVAFLQCGGRRCARCGAGPGSHTPSIPDPGAARCCPRTVSPRRRRRWCARSTNSSAGCGKVRNSRGCFSSRPAGCPASGTCSPVQDSHQPSLAERQIDPKRLGVTRARLRFRSCPRPNRFNHRPAASCGNPPRAR